MELNQSIHDKLIHHIADCGTADRAPKGRGDFAEGCIFGRVVGDGEGGASGVAGEKRVVRLLTTAVAAGDDCARAGVDGALQEGMARAHNVITRVLMKQWSEKGLAEDA